MIQKFISIEQLNLKVPIFPELKKPYCFKQQELNYLFYKAASFTNQRSIVDGLQVSNSKLIEELFFLTQQARGIAFAQHKTLFQTSGQTLNYIVNNALQTIKKHLNQSNRSEIEGQIIRNLISHPGKLLYMLHMDWASGYTDFLQRKNNKPPGPINNTAIFGNQEEANSSEINYKCNLVQDQDFVLLNRNTWLFVHQLYGGGPEVLYLDYLKETQGKRIQDLRIPEGKFNSANILLLLEDSLIQNTFNFNQSISRLSSAHSLTVKLDSSAQSYISLSYPFQSSKFELPPVGFYNESNYCFMNAGLQGLLTIEQMNCWVLNEGKAIVQDNPGPQEKYPWVYSLVELVLAVSQKKAGSFLKIQGLKNLTKRRFDPRFQHDSQEFLRYMIEKLNEELKDQDKNYQTITDILFQGQILSLLTCQNSDCKNTSTKLESFLDLSLPMQNHITLDDCLQEYYKIQYINKILCLGNFKRQLQMPKLLKINKSSQTICYRNSSNNSNDSFKEIYYVPLENKTSWASFFSYMLEYLKVSNYCSSSMETQYRLRSVIVHYGTPERGHYVTFSSRQNVWYYFDDHKIYSVTEMDILEQQAYVLFYEKIEDAFINDLIQEIQ